MGIDVGIGVTNACNLNCSHCYSRDTQGVSYLSFNDIVRIVENVDIDSINFGTGESILHDDFIKIIEYLAKKQIKFSLTSNGYTVKLLPDELLKEFNDIDISYDFPTKWENDMFRSLTSGDLALQGLEKLKKLKVETSIATCMTNKNFDKMPKWLTLREF